MATVIRREMVDGDILPALQALAMGELVAQAVGAAMPTDDAATIDLASKLHTYLEQYVEVRSCCLANPSLLLDVAVELTGVYWGTGSCHGDNGDAVGPAPSADVNNGDVQSNGVRHRHILPCAARPTLVAYTRS
jgi:hypothetical protein